MSACSALHEPLTSTRICECGESAFTHAIRAKSRVRSVPTFIFTVVAPGYQLRIFSISTRSSTSGMVALIGISVRFMGSAGANAASIPLINHGSDSFSSYSRNGENSAQPNGPSKSAISRRVMPRNFVRVGIEMIFSDESTSLRICSDMSVMDV